MRARLGLLVVLGLIAAGGTAVQAQDDQRPIMWHEIADWCLDDCSPTFSDLPNGSTRVMVAPIEGSDRGECEHMHIPADVDGWAYVVTSPDNASRDEFTAEIVSLTEMNPDLRVCELIVSR